MSQAVSTHDYGTRNCLVCQASFEPRHPIQVCCNKECQDKRNVAMARKRGASARQRYRELKVRVKELETELEDVRRKYKELQLSVMDAEAKKTACRQSLRPYKLRPWPKKPTALTPPGPKSQRLPGQSRTIPKKIPLSLKFLPVQPGQKRPPKRSLARPFPLSLRQPKQLPGPCAKLRPRICPGAS